jgi:cardiolipin synthase (CMP-forming)
MTVPNLLTFCRILLTPLLMWFLVNQKMNQALVVFVFAGLTDVLDGLIARQFHQKSRFGALLDPLADKFLLLSSFLILGYLDLIPLWLVVLVVLRDAVIVAGTGTLFLLRVQVEIRPTVLGKLTTLAQLLTILSVLGASLIPIFPWNLVLIWITAGCSIASGAEYVMKGVAAVQSPRLPAGTRR